MDELVAKQNKLNSVDYFLLLLVKFNLCSEGRALRIFQTYRHRIFYRHNIASGVKGPQIMRDISESK